MDEPLNTPSPDADSVLMRRPPRPTAITLLSAMRCRHWLKNLLVFVPLLLAHRWRDGSAWWGGLVVFAGFCAAASSVYLVNDVLDRDADRQHPTKRNRAIASGELSPAGGIGLAAVLLIGAALLMLQLHQHAALLVIAAYLATNAAYSLWLKRVPLLDVMLLSMLYGSRLVAGGLGSRVEVSFWLLAFATFWFMSLAMVKRYVELCRVATSDGLRLPGRGYHHVDVELLRSLGPACGCVAVLVVIFYVNNPAVKDLYPRPEVLWLLAPLLLYWIGRLWLLANREAVDDDPVLFALKDGVSLVVAVLVLLVVLAACWRVGL